MELVADGCGSMAGAALAQKGSCGVAGTGIGGRLILVSVAQLAEHRIVIPRVVGSSPITHPFHPPGL